MKEPTASAAGDNVTSNGSTIHVNAPVHTMIGCAQNITYALEKTYDDIIAGPSIEQWDNDDIEPTTLTHGASLDRALLFRWAYDLCAKKVTTISTSALQVIEEQSAQDEGDVLTKLAAKVLSNYKDASLSSLRALKMHSQSQWDQAKIDAKFDVPPLPTNIQDIFMTANEFLADGDEEEVGTRRQALKYLATKEAELLDENEDSLALRNTSTLLAFAMSNAGGRPGQLDKKNRHRGVVYLMEVSLRDTSLALRM
ncbi:predicted protein [Lichtheimia corymbifera JMRC:FSU:9682]|uniref:Uncharacterized protein n=1 Tax=Lichtheimia corymbifera JMRC:FSU:9682 TaxID=1263082 RepID=A0A068S6J2_9FUNG|nr:predicted protein [Lichtheimia corymbifera JMRC:FSU:9682]